MSSDLSPAEKCLSVAERIIRVLDDPSIYERYMRVKEQMFLTGARSLSPVHSPQARQLALENRSLTLRLQEMRDEALQQVDLQHWAITQLEILQRQILPESSLGPFDSIEEACTAILESIEMRLTTHQFLRDRLEDENRQLQEALEKLRQNTVNEINRSRQARVDKTAGWQRAQIETHKEMTVKEQVIARAKAKLGKLRQANMKLEQTVAEISEACEAPGRKEEAEERLNKAEAERERMKQEVADLKFSSRELTHEIAELRRITELGVGAPAVDPRMAASLLEAEVTELEMQNTSLSTQIAKAQPGHIAEEEEEEQGDTEEF
jgi:hypothetical protein